MQLEKVYDVFVPNADESDPPTASNKQMPLLNSSNAWTKAEKH